MTGLELLYNHSKGINAIAKTANISSSVLGSFIGAIKSFKKVEDLDNFYRNFSTKLHKNRIENNVINVALKLPAKLALVYQNSSEFNRIQVPGDDSGIFVALSTKEYYIHLSMIEQESTETRSSLLSLEQNRSFKRSNHNQFNQKYSSTIYISGSIFNHYQKTIIFGNPGVGKTTFAKWLCHQWSLNELNLQSVPIYISLRDIDFSNIENTILTYLQHNYLRETVISFENLINHFGKHHTFIFDGFDEIHSEQKKRLNSDIDYLLRLNDKVRYIILGRPYAFFDHPLFENTLIHIDGFNEAGIKNYIDALLNSNNFKDKNRIELFSLIDSNDILKEYSHNPLILSSIVLLYVTKHNAKTILSAINSEYDLYHEVYQWMIDYSRRFKKQTKLDSKLLKDGYSFALYCTKNKIFSYASQTFTDIFYETANMFSRVGFGSLRRYDRGERWQFSFSTVTMQEYFAASLLAEKIDSNKFINMSNDPYYWNTCKLIIGALNKKNEDKLVLELLATYHKTNINNTILKYNYFYYSLLSECKKRIIADLIDVKKINELIIYLEQSYFDEEWGYFILDIIRKIYAKLNLEHKSKVKQLVIDKLVKLLSVNHQIREGVMSSYIIYELTIALRLYQDKNFIKSIFQNLKLLISQLRDTINDSNEYDDDEVLSIFFKREIELNRIIFVLFILLEKVDPSILSRYDSSLNDFYNWLPIDLKDDVSIIKAKYQSNDELRNEISENIKKVNKLKKSPYNIEYYVQRLTIELNDHEKYIEYPSSIVNLVHSMFKYFVKNQKIINGDSELIGSAFDSFKMQYLNPQFNDTNEEIHLLTDLLIKGLASLKEIEGLLELMYSYFLTGDLEIRGAEYELIDTTLFKSRLDIELDEVIENPSIEKINFIVFLIKNTINGKYSFAQYKEKFQKAVKEYISLEIESLSNVEYLPDEPPFETIYNLLLSPQFEFDKNYSIDIAIEYADMFPFFNTYLVPSLFEYKESIHEESHIRYFGKFLESNDNTVFVVEQLINRGFFKHKSNIPFLLEALEYIKLNIETNRSVFTDHGAFIIGICSRLMILIVRSNEYSLDNYVELFDAFMNSEEIKSFFTNKEYLESFEPDDLLLYILLYFESKSKKHIVMFDYKHYKQEEKSGQSKLLFMLASLLVPSRTNEELESTKFMIKVMGNELYKDFWNYTINFHLF